MCQAVDRSSFSIRRFENTASPANQATRRGRHPVGPGCRRPFVVSSSWHRAKYSSRWVEQRGTAKNLSVQNYRVNLARVGECLPLGPLQGSTSPPFAPLPPSRVHATQIGSSSCSWQQPGLPVAKDQGGPAIPVRGMHGYAWQGAKCRRTAAREIKRVCSLQGTIDCPEVCLVLCF